MCGTPKYIDHQVSSGGVVVRKGKNCFEIVLCGRNIPTLWALPKGSPDKHEHLQQTALREVQEETGLQAQITASLGNTQYRYTRIQDAMTCHKTVHFYLMAPTGGDTSLHDSEFDHVSWFDESKAYEIMSYDGEIAIVKKAIELAKNPMEYK